MAKARNASSGALACVALISGIVTQVDAQARRQPSPALPEQTGAIDQNSTLVLVRSTLMALQQANETGNYTVLRDLGAPGFQSVNTAAKLGEIFASLRALNLDLTPAATLEPKIVMPPQIQPNGLLRVAGYVPSIPVQVNFDLLFAPTNGRWRLFGISVLPSQAAGPTPSVR